MSYRKAEIFVNESKAGVLEETEFGYRFEYDKGLYRFLKVKGTKNPFLNHP